MEIVYALIAAGAVVWMIFLVKANQKPHFPLYMETKIVVTPDRETPTAAPEVNKDSWEGSIWDSQQFYPVTASLALEYVDAAGCQTKRTVDVHKIGPASYGNLIMGICRLRQEFRTFRADRIQECIDTSTGEIIKDPYGYLMQRYETSPARSAYRILNEEYDILRTLLYVGKADGYLRAPEKTIIRSTCKALSPDARITDEMIDDLFKELEIPTLHAFKLAVGRIADKDADARALVMDAAQQMVATQKKVHAAEEEALIYMQKRFSLL